MVNTPPRRMPFESTACVSGRKRDTARMIVAQMSRTIPVVSCHPTY